MADEYGLVEPDAVEAPGDEWEELDVSDTDADRVARRRDREFDEFRKRIKDSERLKVDESVFDDATYAALYGLVQEGYVDALGGVVSTGKEANVYDALAGSAARAELDAEDTEVAIKVYRITASNFQDMREYLVGDPRFEGIKGDKKAVVLAWTKKEYANLGRARRAGVRVPQPLAVERNVLVMEYLGTEADRARRLSEVTLENPETAYEVVREYARRLYDAGLVHGDLSEYNVVVDEDDELYVLDLGQAVTVHHPNSREFLERDCYNVATFFNRQGMDVDPDDLLAFVTGDG
jgi:RIO kinase 1